MDNNLDALKDFIKNNYTVLNNKMDDMKNGIEKENVLMRQIIEKLNDKQSMDHDQLIKLMERAEQQERELDEFKELEKQYGKINNDRFVQVEKDTKDNTLSYWKVIGIATGVGIIMAIAVIFIQKLF